MRRKSTIIVLVITVFVVAAINSAALKLAATKPLSADTTAVAFSVKPGDSVAVIADSLESAGIIHATGIFTRYAKKKGIDKNIKAGEYTLRKDMSVAQLLETLISGDRKEAWITIPEGWRIDQIGAYLEKEGLTTQKEFEGRAKVKYFASYSFLSGLSGSTSLEGYLFPDTYRVFADSTADDIITVMLDNFGSKVDADIMNGANRLGFSLHEFMTLASIVEKESAHSSDIATIASVYHNRLRDGMLLQSDATITYVTKRPDPSPTLDETRTPSPYNTYLHAGLPPGPVGNPGRAAIEATLNPAETNYYFFVSSGDRAYFATTFEEHQANIVRYLQ